MLFLDTRHRLIEYREMLPSTIDSTSVYAREVIKEGLRLNAAAEIFSHNHPSGKPESSRVDKQLTQRLKGKRWVGRGAHAGSCHCGL